MARRRASTIMSRPPRAWCSSRASSSWKCVRVVSGTVLPDPAGYVGFRPGVGRVGEDLVGLVELDHLAGPVLLALVELDREERGAVRDARGLLHVVRDDHDRVELL